MAEYPNWFAISTAEDNFTQYLAHYRNKPDLRFLQIGAYTGDASAWLCEHVLTDRSSVLIDVDTWGGSPNESVHDAMDWEDVYKTYENKIKKYKRVIRLKMTSQQYFAGDNEGLFDFIYIDGDHTAKAVYKDGTAAWALVKPNGLLAFDDYVWDDETGDPAMAPKQGIDKFLEEHEGEYVLLIMGGQVWIRKNA